MIAIVDVGLGNAGSIANMLRVVGAEAVRTADPAVVARAERFILPGVGAFDTGMTRLEASGLLPLLRRRVIEERVPVLGICLGMQLMTRSSGEGRLPGLGWVAADTRRFVAPPGVPLRIPHMGWNHVDFRPGCALAAGMPPEPRFYFVHSYHVVLDDEPADWLSRTSHGGPFISGFARGNVFGVQFHPEKSHTFGMQLLRNFAALSAA
jgi:glutamine amidotransferase